MFAPLHPSGEAETRSRLNRREHSHRLSAKIPSIPKDRRKVSSPRKTCNFLSKRVRQSLASTHHCGTLVPLRVQQISAAHVSLSSIFSCQRTDIIRHDVAARFAFRLQGPVEVAHAARLISFNKNAQNSASVEANSSVASGAPPSLMSRI